MSGSRVYEFHQREIGDLKTAAVYTLAVCTNLKRLLEGSEVPLTDRLWTFTDLYDTAMAM